MFFIPVAKAQDLDELAVPTIPFDPQGGTITPTPTTPDGPSITLSAQQFGIAVNETIVIQVTVDTKGQEINAFKFSIVYNDTLLEVVDANTQVAGTQINFLDTFFQTDANTASNGLIELSASSSQGSTTVTDRVVAEITLDGTTEGLSQLTIDKENSYLNDQNGTNILEVTNSLSITVSSEQTTLTPTPILPTTLPDNALIDDIGGPGAIILGILLIATGVIVANRTSNARKKGL
ncbi:MAG: cohesin domain-containing protein [Candidatus Dojkabacteria bacterium]